MRQQLLKNFVIGSKSRSLQHPPHQRDMDRHQRVEVEAAARAVPGHDMVEHAEDGKAAPARPLLMPGR